MKDALRLFFFVALALSLLVLWTRWQKWESAAPQAQPELTQTRTPDNINRGINNNDDAKLPVPSQSLIRENISGKSADTDSATSASGGDSFAAITIAEVSENGRPSLPAKYNTDPALINPESINRMAPVATQHCRAKPSRAR